MKNLFGLILIGSLALAGCAQKTVVNDQPIKDVAAVVAEPEAPVVTQESAEPIAAAPVQEDMTAERIFFDLDSSALTPEGKKALEGNALWLLTQQEVRIIIEGHADERGSDAYNLALGEKRAQTVRDYLMSLGIDSERVAIISYGEEKATKGATSNVAWAQDRRAEFVISN
jgi:peptidoglycan-associated lipoprotein